MSKPINQHDGQKGFYIKQPHKLFDYIKEFYKIDSDLMLAHILNLRPSELSRYRNDHKRVNAKVILAVYDATRMPIEKIREMLK